MALLVPVVVADVLMPSIWTAAPGVPSQVIPTDPPRAVPVVVVAEALMPPKPTKMFDCTDTISTEPAVTLFAEDVASVSIPPSSMVDIVLIVTAPPVLAELETILPVPPLPRCSVLPPAMFTAPPLLTPLVVMLLPVIEPTARIETSPPLPETSLEASESMLPIATAPPEFSATTPPLPLPPVVAALEVILPVLIGPPESTTMPPLPMPAPV